MREKLDEVERKMRWHGRVEKRNYMCDRRGMRTEESRKNRRVGGG